MTSPLRIATLALVLALAAAPAGAQPRPIPGAGDWRFVDRFPGVDGPVCTARIDGRAVDTMLLINNDGVPVLIAGRSDWSGLSGEAQATLAVDGGAPLPLTVFMAHNLVLALIADDAVRQRLRVARTLDWTLPMGRFHAEVTGLGPALGAVAACAAAQHQPVPATPGK